MGNLKCTDIPVYLLCANRVELFLRALIPSTAITASHPAARATNLPQSFLLPIAETGGSMICICIARRPSYSDHADLATRLLAACKVFICNLQQRAQQQFCERLLIFRFLHPLNNAGVQRQKCSDCPIQPQRAAK